MIFNLWQDYRVYQCLDATESTIGLFQYMLYFFIKIVVQIKPKIAFRSLPKETSINVSEANSLQIHKHYLP